jgi:hypothetical protein
MVNVVSFVQALHLSARAVLPVIWKVPTLASFSIIALDFSSSLSTVITSMTLVWDGILAVLEWAEQ